MRFSTILIAVVSMTSSLVFADLHNNCICINNDSGEDIYNEAATIASCDRYRNRNTGGKWWDTCPDCYHIGGDNPSCRSDAKHIGGDEMNYYCNLNGARSVC